MNATRRRCGFSVTLAPDINVMTYLLTELRRLSSVTGVSTEYARRADSWRIAGCHQHKDVTVPGAGPADLRHLPCRLRTSEVPELSLEGCCNQVRRLVTVSLRQDWNQLSAVPVSYTHLTLPTIYSV